MQSIIRNSKFITVTLDDGTVLVTSNNTNDMLNAIRNADSDEDIIFLIDPLSRTSNIASKELKEVAEGKVDSQYIELKGSRAYIPSISELTVPQDFVEAILKAEKEEDEDLVQTYLNFWTLVSLNPDSRVRENLFWFIRKWGIKITKSGLLITYRNAVTKRTVSGYNEKKITEDYLKIKSWKKSPKNYYYDPDTDSLTTEEHGKSLYNLYWDCIDNQQFNVYTDQHSHSTTIRIGEPVKIKREDCDPDINQSCTRGLHIASAGWLTENYYGDTGLVCLVNPANVTGVPVVDDYGKMRCCEYLPIAIAEFENGKVKEIVDTHGVDFEYLVDYSGEINNADAYDYQIEAFKTYGIDRKHILEKVKEIISRNEC